MILKLFETDVNKPHRHHGHGVFLSVMALSFIPLTGRRMPPTSVLGETSSSPFQNGAFQKGDIKTSFFKY